MSTTLTVLSLLVAGLSMLIALGALSVSIVDSLRQGELGRRQGALQARLAAIEEERRLEELRARGTAEVTARFDTRHIPGSPLPRFMLVVHNLGPAPARNIDINVSPVTAVQSGPELLVGPSELPIPVLDRGQDFPIEVLIMGAQIDVQLVWDDQEVRKVKTLRSTWG